MFFKKPPCRRNGKETSFLSYAPNPDFSQLHDLPPPLPFLPKIVFSGVLLGEENSQRGVPKELDFPSPMRRLPLFLHRLLCFRRGVLNFSCLSSRPLLSGNGSSNRNQHFPPSFPYPLKECMVVINPPGLLPTISNAHLFPSRWPFPVLVDKEYSPPVSQPIPLPIIVIGFLHSPVKTSPLALLLVL